MLPISSPNPKTVPHWSSSILYRPACCKSSTLFRYELWRLCMWHVIERGRSYHTVKTDVLGYGLNSLQVPSYSWLARWVDSCHRHRPSQNVGEFRLDANSVPTSSFTGHLGKTWIGPNRFEHRSLAGRHDFTGKTACHFQSNPITILNHSVTWLFVPALQHFPSRPSCLIILITTLRRRPTYSSVSAWAGPPQFCLLRLARCTV
jgi:hypothetical protein